MTHLLFVCVFSLAVGVVLAAMLRRGRRNIAILAAWISGAMILTAIVLSWILYALPPAP